MKVTYTMRADGRLYETERYGGTAKHCYNCKICYASIDSMPQEHSTKILMLLAGCSGDFFNVDKVGMMSSSTQVYVDGRDAQGEQIVNIERTRWFELWFDDKEGTDDTNRDAGNGSAPRPAQYF